MRYYAIKKDVKSDEHRGFVAQNLLTLKLNIQKIIPGKSLDNNLLIATWNIRDFDSNKFGHGPRLKESFYYIGQILSSFDLIAVQEVNKNLSALRKVMYILGPNWEFITTDLTEGKSGNQERMTFIYDSRRVSFKNVAGEIVLPKNRLIKGDVQFSRTPFLVSFQSGWTKFSLCTVHIYYGSDYGQKLERRKNEIAGIAKFLKKRADNDKETLIVLGDFNIVDHDHETMKALLSNGFNIPPQIREEPVATNTFQTKYYDQIGIRTKSELFELSAEDNGAGAFNYYNCLFTEEHFNTYREQVIKSVTNQIRNKQNDLAKEQGRSSLRQEKIEQYQNSINELKEMLQNDAKLQQYYYTEWKTFQLSDHLPLWIEIKVDHSDKYLENLKK